MCPIICRRSTALGDVQLLARPFGDVSAASVPLDEQAMQLLSMTEWGRPSRPGVRSLSACAFGSLWGLWMIPRTVGDTDLHLGLSAQTLFPILEQIRIGDAYLLITYCDLNPDESYQQLMTEVLGCTWTPRLLSSLRMPKHRHLLRDFLAQGQRAVSACARRFELAITPSPCNWIE